MRILRWLLIGLILNWQIGDALAASGITQITVNDAGGTSRNIDVTSSTGAVTGNLLWNNVICDATTITQCAAVSAGGALSAAIASGGVASGAFASGSISSGAIASGAVASGAYASGSIADGAEVTIGAKADAKNSATDTTAITIMQVMKEISSLEQAPASRAVTNAGTFAVQATLQASGSTAIGKVDPNTIATWGLATVGAGTAPTNAQIGGLIYNSSAPTPSSGQSVALQGDSSGNLLVNIKAGLNANGQAASASSAPVVLSSDAILNAPLGNLVFGTTAAMTGTSSTQLLAAVSSKVLYVTSIACVNSHATVGTFVTVQDGSGGTALGTLAAAAVYGGDEKNSTIPLFKTTSGNGLYVADVTTGSNVICTASGFHG